MEGRWASLRTGLRRAALGQQRQVRSTGGSLKCVGPAQGEKALKAKAAESHLHSWSVAHEGSQVASCGTCVRCAKTGDSDGARARCCACAHARLRGALEQAAASEATRLRMMQGGGVRRRAARKEDATGWPWRARQRGDGRSASRAHREARAGEGGRRIIWRGGTDKNVCACVCVCHPRL